MRPIAWTVMAGRRTDPTVMVALLLYAYAVGRRSSRGIERACVEDVAYRVIVANQVPDHCTIGRFRQRHEAALAGLFGEVLALCAEAGLVQGGVVAVDGTKVQPTRSRDATCDYEQIAEEILAEADALDREQDERFGDARGDELAPLAGDPSRPARLAARRQAPPRREAGRRGEANLRARAPSGCANRSLRLEEELATERRANADYEAYRARGVMADGRRFGRPPDPYQPPATPTGKINVTDPDSQLVKATRGWIQGYNAQAAVNEQQVVIAAEVTIDSPDFGPLEPMVDAAERELEQVRVTHSPELVVADAGYWHQVQMENIVCRGVKVLIPPDSRKRRGARPGWGGGAYEFMRRVLRTDPGRELYRKRQTMIEPVFGHTKFNRRIDRFQRRGRAACRSEWRLITATHNLLKLHRQQVAPAAA
jgi:hypothetical protein